MHCEVLKPFFYAHDGVSVARLERGAAVEIDDAIALALQAEGFVRGAATSEPAPAAGDKPTRHRGRRV